MIAIERDFLLSKLYNNQLVGCSIGCNDLQLTTQIKLKVLGQGLYADLFNELLLTHTIAMLRRYCDGFTIPDFHTQYSDFHPRKDLILSQDKYQRGAILRLTKNHAVVKDTLIVYCNFIAFLRFIHCDHEPFLLFLITCSNMIVKLIARPIGFRLVCIDINKSMKTILKYMQKVV